MFIPNEVDSWNSDDDNHIREKVINTNFKEKTKSHQLLTSLLRYIPKWQIFESALLDVL